MSCKADIRNPLYPPLSALHTWSSGMLILRSNMHVDLLYLLNHFGGFSALTKKYDSETCKLIIWNHISIDLLYNPDFNRMEFQMVRAELERFFYYTKIEKNNLVLRVL